MNITDRILLTITELSKETGIKEKNIEWDSIAIRLAIKLNKLEDENKERD